MVLNLLEKVSLLLLQLLQMKLQIKMNTLTAITTKPLNNHNVLLLVLVHSHKLSQNSILEALNTQLLHEAHHQFLQELLFQELLLSVLLITLILVLLQFLLDLRLETTTLHQLHPDPDLKHLNTHDQHQLKKATMNLNPQDNLQESHMLNLYPDHKSHNMLLLLDQPHNMLLDLPLPLLPLDVVAFQINSPKIMLYLKEQDRLFMILALDIISQSVKILKIWFQIEPQSFFSSLCFIFKIIICQITNQSLIIFLVTSNNFAFIYKKP